MRIVMLGTGAYAVPLLAELYASAHEVVGVFTRPETKKTKRESFAHRRYGHGLIRRLRKFFHLLTLIRYRRMHCLVTYSRTFSSFAITGKF